MTNIKKPRGTLDILPAETRAWRYAEDIIRREAAASGFEEIRFPTFESTELFDRGVGGTTDIVQKEMYTFTDRDGRSLYSAAGGHGGRGPQRHRKRAVRRCDAAQALLSDQLFPL